VPKLLSTVPAYSLHKRSGQAIIRLSGRDFYLGPFNSPESRERYDRFVAEWLANGRRPPAPEAETPADDGLTIDEMIVRYLEFASLHYRKNDAPTRELANIKDSLRPLHRLFGSTPAVAFGPKRLKTVRERMIEDKLSRGVINQRVGRIIRLFKWAGSEELVSGSVYQSLKTVSGLQRGRRTARETEPVRPVDEVSIEAIRPHVSAQVWAMVALQRLSGMRPGEVVTMRGSELETSGRVWAYRPSSHKMIHRGRDRTVHLGPKAQEILRPWLRSNEDEFLFQPVEADSARKAVMRRNRKSKVQPSQVDRSNLDYSYPHGRGQRESPSTSSPPRTQILITCPLCAAHTIPFPRFSSRRCAWRFPPKTPRQSTATRNRSAPGSRLG
jgi:integrase